MEDFIRITETTRDNVKNEIQDITSHLTIEEGVNEDPECDENYSELSSRIDGLLSVDADTKSIIFSNEFNFTKHPYQVTGAWKTYQKPNNNFTKGCKWAPDGSCIITNSDDCSLHIFNFPPGLYKTNYEENIDWNEIEEMIPAVTVKESELVYDYSWYPLMSSADPITCCVLSTCKNQPIHLWDAFTGALRSTYRPYDHLDEIVAAHSVAFDPQGIHIYTGYNKTIRIFDVSIPGRDFREISTKSNQDGQSGIISCIAINPVNHRIIAAGSYCKTVGLYLEPKDDRLCILAGQTGGVTHICFSPDGTKLYSGGRKDPEILCWDVRNPGKILYTLRRIVTTNQRMYFDLTRDGKYIVTGNQNGSVTIWDTSSPAKNIPGTQEPILEPFSFFQGHQDCVNGSSFHPSFPILATSSGQRKFSNPMGPEQESSDSDCEILCPEEIQDNSLRLWWMGAGE